MYSKSVLGNKILEENFALLIEKVMIPRRGSIAFVISRVRGIAWLGGAIPTNSG